MCVFHVHATNMLHGKLIRHDFYQIKVKCVIKLISENGQTYNVNATAV